MLKLRYDLARSVQKKISCKLLRSCKLPLKQEFRRVAATAQQRDSAAIRMHKLRTIRNADLSRRSLERVLHEIQTIVAPEHLAVHKKSRRPERALSR